LENKNTGNVNEEQKQLINSIKEDSERLLKITGELLNLSQVETGNIQLNIQQSNPYQILKYATDAIKVSADQKHIELVVIADEKLPDVKADTEKTAWVLINFLTNAIRYSPDHSKIKIFVKQFAESDPEGKQKIPVVLFSVKDQGTGIDSRYRDKIFDRYFKVPGSSRTGTGLGLSISKEFIEAQGGHIGVESEVGMGSTFFFRLVAS
jgi:signal transduction histidine kinase